MSSHNGYNLRNHNLHTVEIQCTQAKILCKLPTLSKAKYILTTVIIITKQFLSNSDNFYKTWPVYQNSYLSSYTRSFGITRTLLYKIKVLKRVKYPFYHLQFYKFLISSTIKLRNLPESHSLRWTEQTWQLTAGKYSRVSENPHVALPTLFSNMTKDLHRESCEHWCLQLASDMDDAP